jgi:hypothetical protein
MDDLSFLCVFFDVLCVNGCHGGSCFAHHNRVMSSKTDISTILLMLDKTTGSSSSISSQELNSPINVME